MNTRFLKHQIWLCLCLIFLAVSCYGPELDRIDDNLSRHEEALKKLQEDIDALKTKVSTIDSRVYITQVVAVTGGFRIIFSDNTQYDIVNGQQGPKGTTWMIAPAPTGTVTPDGALVWWYSDLNGVMQASTWKAVPDKGDKGDKGDQGDPGQQGPQGNNGLDGKDGTSGKAAPAPKISPDGFWIIYEWSDRDSLYNEIVTNVPANSLPFTVVPPDSSTFDLYIPRVDSINFIPAKIVYDTIKNIPLKAPEAILPLNINFLGFGYLDPTSKNIRIVDELYFNYWHFNIDSVNQEWKGRGGVDTFYYDKVAGRNPDIVSTGDSLPFVPLQQKLVVAYRSNKAIKTKLTLEDSQRRPHSILGIDSVPHKVEGVLTKIPYSDSVYYSFVTPAAPAYFNPKTGQGRPILFLSADTVISNQGSSIQSVQMGTIPSNFFQLGDSMKVSNSLNLNYFRIDTTITTTLRLNNFTSPYNSIRDYIIKDTATTNPSILNISADKKSFTIKPSIGIDTPVYRLAIEWLTIDGEIHNDQIYISTRDTIRDLNLWPLP
jgi:hypothetical protein